jgi:hypothetical protein
VQDVQAGDRGLIRSITKAFGWTDRTITKTVSPSEHEAGFVPFLTLHFALPFQTKFLHFYVLGSFNLFLSWERENMKCKFCITNVMVFRS